MQLYNSFSPRKWLLKQKEAVYETNMLPAVPWPHEKLSMILMLALFYPKEQQFSEMREPFYAFPFVCKIDGIKV